MNDYGELLDERTVRFERLLPGPVERVWRYLTESEKRALWLCAGDVEPRTGGHVDMHFNNQSLSSDDDIPQRSKRDTKGWCTCLDLLPRLFQIPEGSSMSSFTFQLYVRKYRMSRKNPIGNSVKTLRFTERERTKYRILTMPYPPVRTDCGASHNHKAKY